MKFKSKLKNPGYMMTKLEFLNTYNHSMPDELLEFIYSWNNIKKSPYGNNSYYNAKKSWDSFVDGAIRVSDHWNFYSHGKQHCISQQPVINNEKWWVGIYDEKTETYDLIKSYDFVNRTYSEFIKNKLIEEKRKNIPSEEKLYELRKFKQSVKNREIKAQIFDGLIATVIKHGYHHSKEFIKVADIDEKIYDFKLI